ncbi:MAG TPA: LptA/OstA family protein, partial [Novosphingobium sp.]|nr:LptA/OstA family protein [Novosphingobium sp.]
MPAARLSALALCLALVPASVPALAQGVEAAQETVAFEADRVEYNDSSDDVIASGDVLLKRGDQSVRADSVTWNATSGAIVATGNVRLVDQDGNQLFTDRVTLDEEFRTGAMENMLLALREGGRLAAQSGERGADGAVVLNRAAYSACNVEDAQGCARKPSWRVTAQTVLYDPESRLVRFRGARLELFGAALVPLPGLSVTTDGRAVSGLLVPDISFSPSNGVELRQSWYQQLAPNR